VIGNLSLRAPNNYKLLSKAGRSLFNSIQIYTLNFKLPNILIFIFINISTMSFTPEEKKEIYDNTNVILRDNNFLVVQPLSKNSIIYHNGAKVFSDSYSYYRNGNITLVIDKTVSPPITYSMFTNDKNEVEFYGEDGETKLKRKEFFDLIDRDILNDIIYPELLEGTTYGQLLKIANGEEVDVNDELIDKIKFNPNKPSKSPVIISFEDEEDYFKTIGIGEDDMWIFKSLFGVYYYNRGLDLMSSDRAYNEFREGYLFNYFSEENKNKLNEVVKYISPGNYNFQPADDEEWGRIVFDKILELFYSESDDIIEKFQELENNCIDKYVEEVLTDDTCDIFSNFGIMKHTCFLKYYTTVGILISVYKTVGDYTLSLEELLNILGERKIGDNRYSDWIYETFCNEDFSEELNQTIAESLDSMIEKIEEGGEFEDLKIFDEFYKQSVAKYGINKYNVVPKDPKKKFRILSLNPSTNKIIIEVTDWDADTYEKRELDIEEFNNFLYTGELF
jgi:hypothetical protein